MEAPKAYKDAGLYILLAGAMNALASLGLTIGFIFFCVGILWLIPLGAGLYSAWLGYQMYEGKPVPAAGHLGWIALLTSFFSLNIIAGIISFIAMQKLGDREVTGYLTTSG